MSSLPPKTRHYYPLIPDTTGTRVLLAQRDGTWEPPLLATTDNDLFSGSALSGWVAEQTGLAASQLRVAQVRLDPADGRWAWALIAMENNGGAANLAGARWVDRAELAALPLTVPEWHASIDGWLGDLAGAAQPAERPLWQRPGWWALINGWTGAALAERGQPLLAPLAQRKTWSISTLLRGQTAQGAIYVKGCTTLPLFTNEAAITAELAALFPAHVPTPLAVDAERRLMVLADFGGALLCDSPHEAWLAMVDAYAELQLATVERLDELLAVGCLDRRLPQLAARIPTLAADVAQYGDLSAEELAEFTVLLPRLEAACAELAAMSVPATLAHGDLHDHNIAIANSQPIFFDWSDACIAHPFFDLPTLSASESIEFDPDDWAAIRDRYLSHWTAYAPLAELRRIADLTALLGNLHQVVSYIGIVGNLEPAARWELSNGLDFFARQLLAAARQG